MRDDVGAVSFVILAPLVVVASLMVLQVSLWSHASRVAESAARQGASEASLAGSSDESGQKAARLFIVRAAGDILENIDVSVERSAGEIVVTVTATAPGLLPGTSHEVRAVSVVQSEEFRVD